jgi:hypothetical protein
MKKLAYRKKPAYLCSIIFEKGKILNAFSNYFIKPFISINQF